jgi:hypothetical protein
MKLAENDPEGLAEAEALFQMRINAVKWMLRMALRNGRTLEGIAKKAYVGVSTMNNLLNDVTRRPTAWTLDRIMGEIGWRMTYLPADLPRLKEEPPEQFLLVPAIAA